MESLPREELERLVFFEQAREQAEADWAVNPRDAQARREGASHARCDALRARCARGASVGGCARAPAT
jgi:uncharacterized MAPEG superfamily protein